jgi:hypothetical protein
VTLVLDLGVDTPKDMEESVGFDAKVWRCDPK